MVKWREEAVIDADIETVWRLFLDRNMKKIFPKIEDHVLVEGHDDEQGAKHAQSFVQGNQLMTYVVETLAFEEGPERKQRTTSFLMGGSISVVYSFTLEKMAEGKTRFVYSGSNRGVTVSAKMMLLAGSKGARQATIQTFMVRVREEALKLRAEE
jgi:hypothetical protein